jgi:hypothetical protein
VAFDYNLANNYARQIGQGSNAHRYPELTNMCTSYFLYLRKKLGFYCIPEKEIIRELAFDAVSDAIMAQGKRNLPFTICLQNSFRDLCRKHERIINDKYIQTVKGMCSIAGISLVIDMGAQVPSAEVQVHNADEIQLANAILDNHDRFSKKVVYQKSRGSTYPDLADVFSTTDNECKRVYWHDIRHIRKQFGQNYEN